MTCLEKYRQEHPEVPLERILAVYCPHVSGEMYNMPEPEYCPGDNGEPECERCWNRQIAGTEPTNEEKDPVIEGKRTALYAFCVEQDGCGNCPLGESPLSCDFDTADAVIIDELYDMAFNTADEEPHIRDSGTRQEFSTGAVRDIQKGKGRCDLMPLDVVSDMYMIQNGRDCHQQMVFGQLFMFASTGDCRHLHDVLGVAVDKMFYDCQTMLLEVAKHFEEGAEKYGEGNWQKGLPVKCYINSGVRHYLKWLRGDTDENHDRAFVWNIMCAIWTCKHKPELNDYDLKECPVCSEPLPREAKFCDNYQVSMMDPDDFMGEYEEEND